jgi:hypothetical protein
MTPSLRGSSSTRATWDTRSFQWTGLPLDRTCYPVPKVQVSSTLIANFKIRRSRFPQWRVGM